MNSIERSRLRWRCRRGMLENDLVLERFLQRYGAELAGARLQAFRALLDYDDSALWDLISGRAEPDDPALGEVLGMLRRC